MRIPGGDAPKRQVVQIAILPEGDRHFSGLFALCNDGTIWYQVIGRESGWTKFLPIPQESAS